MSKNNDPSSATMMFQADAAFRTESQASPLFQKLLKKKAVAIDGVDYYVVEGDTLLDEDQLAIYATAREAADKAYAASKRASQAGLGVDRPSAPIVAHMAAGLVAITAGGKIVRWQPGKVLEYRVARDTYRDSARYEMAKECMAKATLAWEETCGIQFAHRADLDSVAGGGAGGALFSVREIDAGGEFIASAFFPNDPPSRRRVLLDPSFFDPDLGFDVTGVLRHELGHVLGFRHEHIRSGAPAVCRGEDQFDTIELTEYDPQSVMHYFCGGRGSRDLNITPLDRVGAQQIYGPPLEKLEYVA